MRALSWLPILAPLSLPVLARPSALRQYQHRRALLDVCAYIDADVVLDKLSVLGIDIAPGIASAAANLDLCLCASAFPLAIQDYTSLSALANILGDNAVSALLNVLINDSPGSQHCTYPDHSKALCSQSDPCGFTCGDGFVQQGNSCVCPPPLSQKNGQCGSFPQGSATSQSKRAAIAAHGVASYQEALSTCRKGESVCGLRTGGSGYECLNTDVELESCGGCIYRNPFLASSESTSVGVDCSQIPNVSDVACEDRKCHVKRCNTGYEVAPSLDSCVKVSVRRQRTKRSHVSATATATLDVQSSASATSSTGVTIGSVDSISTLVDLVVTILNNLGMGSYCDEVASAMKSTSSLSTGPLDSNTIVVSVTTVLNNHGLGHVVNEVLSAMGLASSGSATADLTAVASASATATSTSSPLLGGVLGSGSDPISLNDLIDSVTPVLNRLGLGGDVAAVVNALNQSGSSDTSLSSNSIVNLITQVFNVLGLNVELNAVLGGLGLGSTSASSASQSASASVPTSTASTASGSLLGLNLTATVDGLLGPGNTVSVSVFVGLITELLNDLGLGDAVDPAVGALNANANGSGLLSLGDIDGILTEVLCDLGLGADVDVVLAPLGLGSSDSTTSTASASASSPTASTPATGSLLGLGDVGLNSTLNGFVGSGSTLSLSGLIPLATNVLNGLGLSNAVNPVVDALNTGAKGSDVLSLDAVVNIIIQVLIDLNLNVDIDVVLGEMGLTTGSTSATAPASASTPSSTGSLLSSLGLSSTTTPHGKIHGKRDGDMKLMERFAYSSAIADF